MYDVLIEGGYQLVWLLPLMSAIVFHAMVQGYAAWYFGDKTAKTLGRLSINPLKTVDLIGTIFVSAISWLLFGVVFGWAKRISVSKKMLGHPKEMLMISAMGPISNILQASLWLSVHHYVAVYGVAIEWYWVDMVHYGIHMNLAYAVIQCLPIPPMDAHHIFDFLIPRRMVSMYRKLGQLGLLLIAGLMISGHLSVIGRVIVPEMTHYLSYGLERWIWV